MIVGNTDIDIAKVTNIDYDVEKDLIIIKWEKIYSDGTRNNFYHQCGRKAFGLKDFINKIIEKTKNNYNDEMAAYQTILKKLE